MIIYVLIEEYTNYEESEIIFASSDKKAVDFKYNQMSHIADELDKTFVRYRKRSIVLDSERHYEQALREIKGEK